MTKLKIKRLLRKFWLLSLICRSDRQTNKAAKILEKYYATK